jgi:hypothetical protein
MIVTSNECLYLVGRFFGTIGGTIVGMSFFFLMTNFVINQPSEFSQTVSPIQIVPIVGCQILSQPLRLHQKYSSVEWVQGVGIWVINIKLFHIANKNLHIRRPEVWVISSTSSKGIFVANVLEMKLTVEWVFFQVMWRLLIWTVISALYSFCMARTNNSQDFLRLSQGNLEILMSNF